jgi:hypothetical protein
MDAWQHLRAILLLPGMAAVVVPALLIFLTGPDPFGLGESTSALRVAVLTLGVAFIALGLVLMVATIRLFGTVGQGILAP